MAGSRGAWWRVALIVAALGPGCGGGSTDPDARAGDVPDAAEVWGDPGADPGLGSDDGTRDAAPDAGDATEPPPCAAYQGRGPWPVGVTTLALPDRKVEVWYPAEPGSQAAAVPAEYDIREWLPEGERDKIPQDAPSRYAMGAWRDLPAADARFPLVLFSHGFAAFRTQSSEITTHLASWGFVVAAPDYFERGLTAVLDGTLAFESPDRDTQDAVIDLLAAQDAATSAPLSGRVDTSRVVATGHSAGGFASLKALDLERVAGAVVMAAGFFEDPASPVVKPVMIAAGTGDDIAPYKFSKDAYGKVPPPRLFAGLDGAGHLAFSDLCEIAKEAGGIVQLAIDSGLEVPEFLTILGNDGCMPDELASPRAWPPVNHLTVAFIRYILGIDAEPIGLDAADVEACFGDVLAEYAFQAVAEPAEPMPEPVPEPVPDAWQDASGDVPFDPGPWPAPSGAWSRHGRHLVDPRGRLAMLHGANVSNHAKYAPDLLTWHDEAAFRDLAAIGLDSVRLLTFWAAVMPEDGVIDNAYLDAYVAKIDAAAAAGLDVVVDMHQDLFGVGFGEDGAPRWACDASNYETYVPRSPWYLNYLSDEVMACFDDFYGDPALFGKFVDAWVAVAERVKDHPAVVGFDLLNEPNWGSYDVDRFLPDLWLPLQEQLADALAAAAPGKLVFLEGGTLYLTMGVPEPARPTRLDRVAFAPHFYHNAVHDGGAYDRDAMFALVDDALSAMRHTADVLGRVPVWVGEFGGPWSVPGFDAYMTDLFTGMAARGFGWSVYCDDRSGEDGFGIRDLDGAIRPGPAALLAHPKVRRVPGPVLEHALAPDLSAVRVVFRWEVDAPLVLWSAANAVPGASPPEVRSVASPETKAPCARPEGGPDGLWECPRPAGATGAWEAIAGVPPA